MNRTDLETYISETWQVIFLFFPSKYAIIQQNHHCLPPTATGAYSGQDRGWFFFNAGMFQ